MHQTAEDNFRKFLEEYHQYLFKDKTPHFLDIGSCDVNGTLRAILEEYAREKGVTFKYTGIDMEEGKNVDVVYDGRHLPFVDQTFDVVTSSSCFEHDKFFWETFKEMARVVKGRGWMYINAPSTGPYHAYPIDCWRFYKDSWAALAEWCPIVSLRESYIDEKDDFKDSVGIFYRRR